jgi:hypothetical protein
VVPAIRKLVKPGGVYLGVAPDQNFTYLLASDPKVAFIVDIRRGNLHTQLMYKALIELSSDRADFVSRLFSKKRPAGLTAASTPAEIFRAFYDVKTEEDLYKANLQAIDDQLVKHHGIALPTDDLKGIEYVYWNFYWYGPAITYSSSSSTQYNGRGNSNFPSYADLMLADDGQGQNRSYLGSDANFQAMKAFEEKNLLVPVVGDFAGPKALRAVGKWIREHGSVISAFYTSNVEQYLFQEAYAWRRFLQNVATFPIDSKSTFIRSISNRGFPFSQFRRISPAARASTALCPINELVKAFNAGQVHRYEDVVAMSK